jgi:hypothetical protein
VYRIPFTLFSSSKRSNFTGLLLSLAAIKVIGYPLKIKIRPVKYRTAVGFGGRGMKKPSRLNRPKRLGWYTAPVQRRYSGELLHSHEQPGFELIREIRCVV